MKLKDELLDRCASLVINRNSIQYIHTYIAYHFFFFFYWAPGSTAACRLILLTCTARSDRPLARKWGTMGEKCPVNFAVK
jgi:hypothetical protein